ncbi:MAG: tRNA lysidine(34) synthetase TilS [bacterium]|nr:tRNA lysidine(34) synthetase TilS [bacterium]
MRSSPFLRALEAGLAPVAPGEHLVLAVSGGPDSTAMLAGVAALAGARGWTVTAVHVDHGLRGAESADEGARVAALAARLGAACVRRTLAMTPGPGLEARARRRRYAALLGVVSELGATRLCTAHTRDDQAETVLLRLLRGAGRRGLGGMRPRRGKLLRPLLGASRADVRRYLAERGLDAAVDRTNADLRHTRNRVRRLALPFLAAEFDARLPERLAALAMRLRDEDDLLAALAAERLRALADATGLSVAAAAEPPALARRVVRAWLEQGRRADVDARHVERVLDLAAGRERGTIAIPGASRVVREGDRLLRRVGRAAPPAVPFALRVMPGETIEAPDGEWRMALSAVRARAEDEWRPPPGPQALFDAARLPTGLVVRPPRPGDRVRIAGVGTRKLSDVLIDRKVPREARGHLPVLVGDGTVLWVPGVVRAATALLESDTRWVVAATWVTKG